MSDNFVETNAYRAGFASPVKPFSSSNIFCVPLESLKMTEEEMENHRQRQVPEIIFALGAVLKNHAQITEGIFRLSSTNRNIRRLKESLELASNQVNSLLAYRSELTNSSEPHAMATVLKHLIRDLPEPLIPVDNYKDFLRICDEENMKKINGKSEINVPELRKQIAKLPKVNHDVLHYLVELMIAVEDYKEVNKMGAKALSVVFGPNIFRVSDGMEGLKEQAITNRLVQEMISNYDKLFLPSKSDVSVNQHHSSTDSAIHVNDCQFSPEIRNLIKDRLHNFVFGNSDSKASEKGDYVYNSQTESSSNSKNNLLSDDENTVKIRRPSKRLPSKSARSKFQTDIFDEFNNRTITNIGRVDSVKKEKPEVKLRRQAPKAPEHNTEKQTLTLVSSRGLKSPEQMKREESNISLDERLLITTTNNKSLQTRSPDQNDKISELKKVVESIKMRLADKRKNVHNHRSEKMDKWSLKDFQNEKADLQRELLALEKNYGRASKSNEKDIVREIYDRYRLVKRKINEFNQANISNSSSNSTAMDKSPLPNQRHLSTPNDAERVTLPVSRPVSSNSGIPPNETAISRSELISKEEKYSEFLNRISDMSLIQLKELKSRIETDRFQIYNQLHVIDSKIDDWNRREKNHMVYNSASKVQKLQKEKAWLKKHMQFLTRANGSIEQLLIE